MRKFLMISATVLAIFVLAAPSVMASNRRGTGEGNFLKNFYQWLRDDDGDGIPNCLDPDYVKPEDGSGYGKLGLAVSLDGDKDKDQAQDQIRLRDQDQYKDGSCTDETCDGSINVYRLRYKGANSPK